MKPAGTVQKIYRDFAIGDAAAILATFADDVEFRLAENHPLPRARGAANKPSRKISSPWPAPNGRVGGCASNKPSRLPMRS